MELIDRDRLVCIGKVSDAHGLEGEIKVLHLTSSPQRYTELGPVFLDTPHGLSRHTVQRLRPVPGHWLVRLEDVKGRAAAEALRGAEMLVTPEQVPPLAEGEFFSHDLLGCTVLTESGTPIGAVKEVVAAGGGSLLRVVGGPGEVLVPLDDSVVKRVDVGRREIRIDPPPGLLDLNA